MGELISAKEHRRKVVDNLTKLVEIKIGKVEENWQEHLVTSLQTLVEKPHASKV